MRGLVFQGIKQVSVDHVKDPEIEDPRDAIVEVKRTALCGSDLHVFLGREQGLDAGTVLGHEFTGQIVAKGDQVYAFEIGDRVVSPFTTSCGQCFYCRSGLPARCEQGQLYGWRENGHGLHGAQAELVRVPLADSTLMKIPSSVNDESALLSGDILATGWHCATKAQIKPDGIYVVIGCGPVGLMSILAARALGARNLYAIDPIEERRKQAEKWGAASIDPTKVDPQEIILKASKGRGADAALEAVGSNVTLTLAVNLLRPGGILSSVGVHTAKEFPFSPIMAYDKNLEMHIGRCPARYYMPSLLAWLESAELDFSSFFTHRMKLSEAAEAYRIFNTKSQGCIKALLIPD